MASGNMLMYNPHSGTQEYINRVLEFLRQDGVTIENTAQVVAPRFDDPSMLEPHELVTLVSPDSGIDQLESAVETAFAAAHTEMMTQKHMAYSGLHHFLGQYADDAMAGQALPAVQLQLAGQYNQKCKADLEGAIKQLKAAEKQVDSILKRLK
jgi:hypothetical protein